MAGGVTVAPTAPGGTAPARAARPGRDATRDCAAVNTDSSNARNPACGSTLDVRYQPRRLLASAAVKPATSRGATTVDGTRRIGVVTMISLPSGPSGNP